MKRLTKRSRNGNVYATGPATVCWGGRTAGERLFCVDCHGDKDNRGIDRSKCGPLAIIDRLADCEDTGLEPEEIVRLAAPEPNAPLTLEELREMDGEPAYFVNKDDPCYSMWCIVWVQDIFGVKKVSAQGRTFGVAQCFCSDESYGRHWIAYRRKPEEGGHAPSDPTVPSWSKHLQARFLRTE